MGLLMDCVVAFADGVSGIMRDMSGAETTPAPSTARETKFAPSRGMAVMIHFTGAIQGEFAIALSEETAAKLLGSWSEGMASHDLKAMRADSGGFLKEVLNIAVGQVIPGLEREFDSLSFLPAVIVYGELEYPDVPAGSVLVVGDAGEIDCYFVLNLMGLEPGERLQSALKALGESIREATEAKRCVASMLDAFPTGLVTVDRNGRVRPGYARITPETVGLDRDTAIPGMHVAELMGLPPKLVEDTSRWLEVVYDRWETVPFKDLVGLCPISETANERGILVRPEWVPVRREDGGLDALLLMIEDLTEKRRVEEEMRKLSRLHEESAELLTQIVNLESDEVQDFVYDSSGLLREAERIVQDGARDRKFIESLYRTVHTLKGNSGQFQFKGLQNMALGIENEIAKFKEQAEWDTAQEVDGVARIQKGIEEAEGYIHRLEELRGKLGSREEGIEEKANRAAPAVMAPLLEIDSVAASIWGVHQAGCSLGWPSPTLGMLADAASSAASLREVEFSRLGRTLQQVVSKLANRLGKKVNFAAVGNGTMDVEIQRVLHRCMVHLIGNALDHGIEAPEVRLASGKLETGILALEYSRGRQNVEIALSDDGAGMDLEFLRRKAQEKGFLDADQARSASPPELLDLVFRAGFSTRDKVGEFSGGGAGLDMVRDAVQSLGGSIRLESVFRRGSTFRIRIPLSVAAPSTRFRSEIEA